jgi:hypothetical protein
MPHKITHIMTDNTDTHFDNDNNNEIVPKNVLALTKMFTGRKLLTLDIPNSVTSIGDYALRGCSSLKAVNIPESVTSIGRGAFSRCTSLKLIAIPQSVTDIKEDAFDDCYALQQRLEQGQGQVHRDGNANIYTWLQQRFSTLPLHQALYNSLHKSTMTTTRLTELIEEHGTMLNSTDTMLMTPLHVICCSSTVTTEMIRMLKDASPDAASMRNVMDETPLMMYLRCRNPAHDKYHLNGELKPLEELLRLGIEANILSVVSLFYDTA